MRELVRFVQSASKVELNNLSHIPYAHFLVGGACILFIPAIPDESVLLWLRRKSSIPTSTGADPAWSRKKRSESRGGSESGRGHGPRGGRTAHAERGRSRTGRAGCQGAHDPGPLRRDRLRPAQEPRRERPGERGRLSAWATSTSYAPGPTFRSTISPASRRGRSSSSSPGSRECGVAHLPLEQKKFRGKITFVDPQIQPVAETAVRIYAEFENKDRELQPGLKGVMTIYLTPDMAAPSARPTAPTVGARTTGAASVPR